MTSRMPTEKATATRRSLLLGAAGALTAAATGTPRPARAAATLKKVKVVIPQSSVFVLSYFGGKDAGVYAEARHRSRYRRAALCRLPCRPAEQAMHGGDLFRHRCHPEDQRRPGLGDHRRRADRGAGRDRAQEFAVQDAGRSARQEIRNIFDRRRLVQGGKGGDDRRLQDRYREGHATCSRWRDRR